MRDKCKVILSLMVAAVFVLGSDARAAPPSDELLRTYLEETGARAAYELMLTSMPATMLARRGPFIESFNEMLRGMGYSEAQVSRAQVGFEKFMEKFANDALAEVRTSASWEIIEQQVYFPILREQLSTEELEAAIAFNRTPQGRSLRDKQPGIAEQAQQRMLEALAPYMKALPQRVNAAVEQEYSLWIEALGPPEGAAEAGAQR